MNREVNLSPAITLLIGYHAHHFAQPDAFRCSVAKKPRGWHWLANAESFPWLSAPIPIGRTACVGIIPIQGSLLYTPEHCLVNGGFLYFGGKSHVSNGQNVSFKEPCNTASTYRTQQACPGSVGHSANTHSPLWDVLSLRPGRSNIRGFD